MDQTAKAAGDLIGIVGAVKDLGITGIVLLAFIGGFRRWWVFGWIYEQRTAEIERDRDEWRRIALSGMDIGKRGTQIASDVIGAERERR
jgi:hypothetical protein